MGTLPASCTKQRSTMLRALLIACLSATVLAQTQPSWFLDLKNMINGVDDTIDRLHNFRLEYHHDSATREHLLIAISDYGPTGKTCHFIEISPVWESLLQDRMKVRMISEEIYHKINDPNVNEVTLTADQLAAAYQDNEAATECAGHAIRVLSYSPSQAVMAATHGPHHHP